MRALCLHGHFYQPPREHPWLGVVEPERSAAPYRDWNSRITAECYRPNAAARVLDTAGRLRAVVNTYEWTSFDVGPTLLGWLAGHAPDVVAALAEADVRSLARTGHGNAWAQAYGHPILPLSTPRDVRTQVLWGRREFEHRFGRPPEGMWLPEMAVDRTALEALAAAGIGFTMLSPHQARRIRALGAASTAWEPVTAETLDRRRLYRCALGPGRAVDVVFRDPHLSHDIAFGSLLLDGTGLATRLREALSDAPAAAIVAVAVDGETYGHHHRFAEMALAFAIEAIRRDPGIALVGPAAFRERHPPTHEVEVADGTSWSCVHGVERWRADCGCRVNGAAGWSQAWRAPLRHAIDWLRDQLASLYESRGGEVFRDPWDVRDRYVECVLEPARAPRWLHEQAVRPLSPAGAVEARRLLELARHALLMQTSCGWFFDELTGIEPVQILRYAARAIELAEALGGRCEDGFLERLEPARSNLPARESGADLYRRAARGEAATPARVAATGAMLALLDRPPVVPGHELRLPGAPVGGRLAGAAEVVETATGATTGVPIAASRAGSAPPTCRADGFSFTLDRLFGVQRERLVAALAREAGTAALHVLDGMEPLLGSMLGADGPLPAELAALVGWETARAIADGLERGTAASELAAAVAAARRRGAVLPAAWLGPRLARTVTARMRALPGSAGEVLALLDLVKAADARVDLGPAQVAALTWWTASRPAVRDGEPLAILRDRLAIAPEES